MTSDFHRTKVAPRTQGYRNDEGPRLYIVALASAVIYIRVPLLVYFVFSLGHSATPE